jgi:hypothetical protein
MPVTENLAVQMHQQDTDYYCGAACAQMVLQTIGAGLLDQDDLYADNHSHSTLDAGVNWATGPDGLQWTLMDRRPPAFTNYFALYALDTEDLISRKLCWTIHHYQVAPIALVYGWAHWITVRGYTASAHPASSADNSYTIDASISTTRGRRPRASTRRRLRRRRRTTSAMAAAPAATAALPTST